MPTPQEALAALLGGGSRRVRPTGDYGFSGAVPTQGELESPFEREQAARAAEADARDRAATDAITARNAEINDYNRPEVTQIRNDAFARSLIPAQIKAQAQVEAARQATIAQSQRDERLYGGRAALQEDKQAADIAKQQASMGNANRARGQQAKRAELMMRLKTASGSGLGNLFGLAGQSDKAKLEAELSALDQEMLSGGEAPAMVDASVAPPSVDPARLARLRAAMGR